MDFGNKIIYKCPKCGKLVYKFGIISMNNFGAAYYSDGGVSGLMHSEEDLITKCSKCKTIYWLDKENVEGECYGQFSDNPKWNAAKSTEWLKKNDFIDALEQKIYRNKDEELCIRNIVWRKLSSEYDLTKDEEKIYKSNCKKLLKFYNIDNINEKLLIAELHRNLGNFDECTEILKTIKNKDYIWIRNLLLYECEKKNKRVVRLIKGSIKCIKKGNKMVFEEPVLTLFCQTCGTTKYVFKKDKPPFYCGYCKKEVKEETEEEIEEKKKKKEKVKQKMKITKPSKDGKLLEI